MQVVATDKGQLEETSPFLKAAVEQSTAAVFATLYRSRQVHDKVQGKNLRRLSFLCDKDKQPSKPSQKAAVATTNDAFFFPRP